MSSLNKLDQASTEPVQRLHRVHRLDQASTEPVQRLHTVHRLDQASKEPVQTTEASEAPQDRSGLCVSHLPTMSRASKVYQDSTVHRDPLTCPKPPQVGKSLSRTCSEVPQSGPGYTGPHFLPVQSLLGGPGLQSPFFLPVKSLLGGPGLHRATVVWSHTLYGFRVMPPWGSPPYLSKAP